MVQGFQKGFERVLAIKLMYSYSAQTVPGSELQHKLFAQNLVEAARAGQVLQKG